MENNIEERVIKLGDPEYPPQLAAIDQPPQQLYCRGNISLLKSFCVAVVGSRKLTKYGMWAAGAVSRKLAGAGVTVVSGMAKGADTCAHRGALEEKGNTIAVLGCGLDITYPASNRALKEEIACRGLLVTEYPYGYPATTRIDNQEIIFLRTNTSYASMSSPSDEFEKIIDHDNDLRALLFFTNLYGSRPINMMRTQQSGISVSEMYLTIAEAALRKSSPDVKTAIEALDAVRSKRYLAETYQPTTITDVKELLDEVIKERRREVSFCTTSFTDKKRWNCDPRTATTMTRTIFGKTYTMEPNDPRYCLPIPPNVMQMNPNLVDNER